MSVSASQPSFSNLTLAAYGWSPANWSQAFYPDDLPQAWQVSYYCNEFIRILLPASVWESPLTQAASWVVDAGEGFGFYLELTRELLQSTQWLQVQTAVEQHLAPLLLGLLVDVDTLPLLPVAWAERFPVHRRHPGQWLAEMPVGAEAQLGVLHSLQALSPSALRALFEQIQRGTAHRDVILFLDAPWTTLEQVRLMQQLYGV